LSQSHFDRRCGYTEHIEISLAIERRNARKAKNALPVYIGDMRQPRRDGSAKQHKPQRH
jgi:hypothetical protein